MKHDPALTFAFDTRVVFMVGSPLAFFLHLGKGQLIARAGRERTKNAPKDVALERSGRYGCLAVDTIYNGASSRSLHLAHLLTHNALLQSTTKPTPSSSLLTLPSTLVTRSSSSPSLSYVFSPFC